ncbi:MAG TPA: HXXEE domain-containing protein, partial [Gemmatimonadaceae bacterium]|nr:HXXEE domain-containing protein [Gemmatimonadaceae bacterium]
NNDVATFINASMRGLDARLGPSAGSASLLAVCFHILPAIVQRRVSPGVCTAALLYLPFLSGPWQALRATACREQRS